MLRKMVIAWDLDGTLVDSSHRTRYVNGEFDLTYWQENAKKEEVLMKDKLLPLYEVFLSFQNAGYTQICVTARAMNENDFKYLEKHNMNFDMILHRGDSVELDHILKSKKLKTFFNEGDRIPFMAFDDKEDNLKIFDKFGFRTFQALYMNEKLRKKSFKDIYFKPSDFEE